MRFNKGQIIHLGSETYQIRGRLGSGAVADVYEVNLVAEPEVRLILKLARGAANADPLHLEGIRREGEVLEILNRAEDEQWPPTGVRARLRRIQDETQRQKRRIIALLDSGDFEGSPFLVQEMAPPAFERFQIDSLEDEYRMLAVAHAIAGAMALAHDKGLAFKDFQPETKSDRIRVQWLDPENARFEMKIIDWNITGDAKDFAADLFMLGGHLYRLFLGRDLVLDSASRPPVNLGAGITGWDKLTAGTRQIIRRLLHRDPKRRYQKATDLLDDLTWWLETLEQAQRPNPFPLLDARRQPRLRQREDRNLALAKLALSLNPSPDGRKKYEFWIEQARAELEKEIWQPIALARANLLRGAYRAAITDLEQQLNVLPKESQPARVVRLYLLKAQIGNQLKVLHQGRDIRPTPEWGSVEQAIENLLERRWGKANGALLELMAYQPVAKDWEAVKKLQNLIRAGMTAQEAARQIARLETAPPGVELPDWLEREANRLDELAAAVEKIRQACELAPLEVTFDEQLQAEERNLQTRRDRLAEYREIHRQATAGEEALQQGKQAQDTGDFATAQKAWEEAIRYFQHALETTTTLLNREATLPYARYQQKKLTALLDEAKAGLQMAQERKKIITRIENLFREGEYQKADPLVRELARGAGETPMKNLLAEAEAGIFLQNEVHGQLTQLERAFDARRLDSLEQNARRLLSWDGAPFTDLLPPSTSLPALKTRCFAMSRDTKNRLENLLRRVEAVQDAEKKVAEYRQKGDYGAIIDLMENLRRKAGRLHNREEAWLTQARQAMDELEEATRLLEGTPGLEDLHRVERLLAEKHGERATALYRRWQEARTRRQIEEAQAKAWQQAQRHFERIREHIRNRELNKARELAGAVQKWPEQPLGDLLDRANLPDKVGRTPFAPPPEFTATLRELEEDIRFFETIRAYRREGKHRLLMDTLDEDRHHSRLQNYPLTEEEKNWREEAQKRLENLARATEKMDSVPHSLTVEAAREIYDLLEGDPNPEARLLFARAQFRLAQAVLERAMTNLDSTDLKQANTLLHSLLDSPPANAPEELLSGAQTLQNDIRTLEPLIAIARQDSSSRIPDDILSWVRERRRDIDALLQLPSTLSETAREALAGQLQQRTVETVRRFVEAQPASLKLSQTDDIIALCQTLRQLQDEITWEETARASLEEAEKRIYRSAGEWLEDTASKLRKSLFDRHDAVKPNLEEVKTRLNRLIHLKEKLGEQGFPGDENALQQWQKVVEALETIAGRDESVLDQQPEKERLKNIRDDLKKLKEEIARLNLAWETLGLSPGEELENLSFEAEIYHRLAEILMPYAHDPVGTALKVYKRLDELEEECNEKNFSLLGSLGVEMPPLSLFSSGLLAPHWRIVSNIIRYSDSARGIFAKAKEHFANLLQSGKGKEETIENIAGELRPFDVQTWAYWEVERALAENANPDKPDKLEIIEGVLARKHAPRLQERLHPDKEKEFERLLQQYKEDGFSPGCMSQALKHAVEQCPDTVRKRCRNIAEIAYEKVFGEPLEPRRKKLFGLFG